MTERVWMTVDEVELTLREALALNFITRYHRENSLPPSHEELLAYMNVELEKRDAPTLVSTQQTQRVVTKLRSKMLLKDLGMKRQRSLVATEDGKKVARRVSARLQS